MQKKPLDRLCDAYGLQLSYRSVSNRRQVASDATKRAVLGAMSVAAHDDDAVARSLADAPTPLDATIAAPADARCYMPDWLENGRAWGVTCQLYGLRSARNHGIGDFEDLASLAEEVAAEGGDFVGINPVHALFTADPVRCSPFSPSNRSFLNPLYIALDRIAGTIPSADADAATCARLRASTHVDYPAVSALKLGALRAMWQRIGEERTLMQPEAWNAFDAYIDAGGPALQRHALFEALSHQMVADGYGAGWHGWPDRFRESTSAAVQRFALERESDIRFHLWLQWVADSQLGVAAERARAAGMRIGLYLDFAAGTAPDGSATWSDPELVVTGANIGAPPDAFFVAGQDWGLAPLSPAILRRRSLEPYRSVLEASIRHAGAIRIDHAMNLHRLFWIPHGMSAAEGCYVLYPMADMLRTLGEVSTRQRTIVIGEDLGTVPPGFEEAMAAVDMLSCRVLYFEWVRGGFRSAASYRRSAFVSVSTHDLSPLAAWWTGADIAHYRSLGLLDTRATERRRKDRDRDRLALIERLRRDVPCRSAAVSFPAEKDKSGRVLTQDIAVAVHAFLARTPSRLLGVQFEDLCGADAPVNVPGTWKEYPNWRLRARLTVEEAAASELWARVLSTVARERPRLE